MLLGDLAVTRVDTDHRVKVGKRENIRVRIKDITGLGGSSVLVMTATNSVGTTTILSMPFTVPPRSATVVRVDYTYVTADIPLVTFQACISPDSNSSNNCGSDDVSVTGTHPNRLPQ